MKYFRKISVIICIISLSAILFTMNHTKAALNFGSEMVIRTATTYQNDVTALYDGRFVAAVRSGSVVRTGTVRYCDHTGTTITSCSTVVTFNNANTGYIQIARLTDTSFVIVYNDMGSYDYGTAVYGSISAGTLTVGSEYKWGTSPGVAVVEPHVDRLSDTKFVVTYKQTSDGDGYSVIGDITDVSNKIITFGSPVKHKDAGAGVDRNVVASLVEDSNFKFVVAYHDLEATSDGAAKIGTVSGNVITFGGSETVFDTGAVQREMIDKLNDNKFVISYSDNADLSRGYSIIGEVSGNSIIFGTRDKFNDAATDHIDVAALNEYTINVAYTDVGNSSYGTSITGIVTNDVISHGLASVYNSSTTQYNHISYIPNTSQLFIITYSDGGNSNYGTAIIGQEDAPGGPAVPEFTSWVMRIIVGTLGFMAVIFFGIFIKKKLDSRKDKK